MFSQKLVKDKQKKTLFFLFLRVPSAFFHFIVYFINNPQGFDFATCAFTKLQKIVKLVEAFLILVPS